MGNRKRISAIKVYSSEEAKKYKPVSFGGADKTSLKEKVRSNRGFNKDGINEAQLALANKIAKEACR